MKPGAAKSQWWSGVFAALTVSACASDSPTSQAQQGKSKASAATDAAMSGEGDGISTSASTKADAQVEAPAARSKPNRANAPNTEPRDNDDNDDDAGAAAPATSTSTHHMLRDKRWVATRPRTLSMLVGPTASYAAEDTQVYGSDMASSFEHADKVVVLFGDTFPTAESACDRAQRANNDMAGTLPTELTDAPPKLEVVRGAGSRTFGGLHLFHGGTPVALDDFKIPIAGFSDGTHANVLFQAQVAVTCDPNQPEGQQGCPPQGGVTCASDLSFCEPAPVTVPNVCEPQQPACLIGGCTKGSACTDSHSSQYDGSSRGRAASVMSQLFFSQPRGEDLTTYDVVGTFPTNVFSHAVTRTVTRFSGKLSDSDYSQGYGQLLLWGRPAMHAEEGRQARMYFATLPLPLPLPLTEAALRPRFYAGSEDSGEPKWSDDAADAAPLAMDGQINGDPSEPQGIVTTSTVSWLGEPINQWVMMYGGDLPDALLADPNGTRGLEHTGAIMLRFADHPWGPWSPAAEHLPAGSPSVVGDAYGPGGILFHPDCRDQGDAKCAQGDPANFALCATRPLNDLGRMYAPAIIDAYTHPNAGGGMDITWAVSTWAPYAAYLMQTSINPE
jgi:hypothetical protein